MKRRKADDNNGNKTEMWRKRHQIDTNRLFAGEVHSNN